MIADTIRQALKDNGRISRAHIQELLNAYDSLANFATQKKDESNASTDQVTPQKPANTAELDETTEKLAASMAQIGTLTGHIQTMCEMMDGYITRINHNIILDPLVDQAERRLKRQMELARKATNLMLDI